MTRLENFRRLAQEVSDVQQLMNVELRLQLRRRDEQQSGKVADIARVGA